MGLSLFPIAYKVLSISDDHIPKKVLSSILQAITQTPRLLLSLLTFVSIILLLHFLVGFFVWKLWTPFVTRYFNKVKRERLLLSVTFFLIVQFCLLGINKLLFPSTSLVILQPLLFALLGGSIVSMLLIWHSFQLFKQQTRASNYSTSYIALMLIPISSFLLIDDNSEKTNSLLAREQPDIIIIGFDSFRPDHLGLAAEATSVTPNLDNFLLEAYRFDNTYTPMARTYPAWMSILTGRYPIEHGARFNLTNTQYLIEPKRNLPFILRGEGYTTAYAIDESRFSNIDNSYGFDMILTPEMGATGFILASVADLPLRNLFNFSASLGALLFPHHYMNRAISNVYDPKTFASGLNDLISATDKNKPLFLVTHFELPHWPFTWHVSQGYKAPENERLAKLSPVNYHKAVHRADAQFRHLMDTLKYQGRLKNAIVVVLSDHGEGFSYFPLSWQPVENSKFLALPMFSWHGTNVLDKAQTQVLLAFKSFGNALINKQGSSSQLTSLIDIAPTLLELTGKKSHKLKASGCDLFLKQSDCLKDRVIFTESGFYLPKLFANENLDVKKIAEESIAYYDVGLDTRMTIKPSFLGELLAQKQRAAIRYDGVVVASMPQQTKEQFLVGSYETRKYRDINYNSSLLKGEALLLDELCEQYSGDAVYLGRYCSNF